MWAVLKNDLRDFVSTVTTDTKDIISSVMKAGESHGQDEEGETARDQKPLVPPEVLALQNSRNTYLEAVEEQEKAAWTSFVKTFDLASRAGDMEQLLKQNPVMSELHGELVGEAKEVSSELFWTRYFFKENRLSSKGPLRLDLGGEEEEELSWGDDEDEEEQGEAQAASPPPKPAEEPQARPAVATDSEAPPAHDASPADQSLPVPPSPADRPSTPPASRPHPSVQSTPDTPGYPRMSEADQVSALSRDIVGLHARLRELEERNEELARALGQEREAGEALRRENHALRAAAAAAAQAAKEEEEQASRVAAREEERRPEQEVAVGTLPVVKAELERSFSEDAVKVEAPSKRPVLVADEEEDDLDDDWA